MNLFFEKITMPRPLRLEYENAWYHVMNRGASHQNIFKSDIHRNEFLSLLREASLYYNIECHAFCLMDNHYHLLLHTPQGNLSQGMRHLNGIYTQCFNRSEKRDGALFRGRYKAILIEEDAYLLYVSRYIHLNPVSANMVTAPENYEWSSYKSYITFSSKFPWLKTDMILAMISQSNQLYEYKKYVDQGIDNETKQFYSMSRQPVILGRDIFKAEKLRDLPKKKILASLSDYNVTAVWPSIDLILDECANYFSIKHETLLSNKSRDKSLPRTIAMYLCRTIGNHNLNEISLRFNCKSKNGAASAVCRIKSSLRSEYNLAKLLSLLEARILEKQIQDVSLPFQKT